MAWLLPTGNQINLQLGWPSAELFPSAELNSGANEVLSSFDSARAALIYGPNPGIPALRKEVARWLSSVYFGAGAGGDDDCRLIDSARVCIAGGASQNLSNILLRFTDPTYTRKIWMVEPTYFLACPVFEDCGYVGKLRGVPEDDEGIDLDFLRAGLEEAEKEAAAAAAASGSEDKPHLKVAGYEKIYKHVIYTVPTFSNPSGKTMSLHHREALVRLAIEFDALIVSDDVYDMLCWPADRNVKVEAGAIPIPPRLVDVNLRLDPESKWGNTVSNGSFSKIIAPGARVSWSESTPAFATFLANTGATWSGGNPAQLTSNFVERILASGSLEKHIKETLIPTYASRYYTMVDAIHEYLEPLGVHISTGKPYTVDNNLEVAGGFFLCVSLPKEFPHTSELAAKSIQEQELKFAHGRMFGVKGDAGSRERAEGEGGYGSNLRLCWSFHTEEKIVEGIKRLRDVLAASKTS